MTSNSEKLLKTGAKRKTGRPPGCRLDVPAIQNRMLRQIAKTGEERFAYVGICAQETYMNWKSKTPEFHAAWMAKVWAAIGECEVDGLLADPKIKRKIIRELLADLENGKMSPRDKLMFLDLLPKYRNAFDVLPLPPGSKPATPDSATPPDAQESPTTADTAEPQIDQ